MQKLDGVESVEVSLNKGEALLRLKPGNSVTIEKVRQVVIDSGFTPKDADAEVVGKIVERDGKPSLAVSGVDLVYELVDDRRESGKLTQLREKAREKDLVVKGHLPETTTKGRAKEPKVLEVRDFVLPY
jgi:copper chaperone CopZ